MASAPAGLASAFVRGDNGGMAENRSQRLWYQFSLRTLLALILVLAVPLTWVSVRRQQGARQRQAVEAILELGGKEFNISPAAVVHHSAHYSSTYIDKLRA